MGRAPCCDKANVKKGPWSPEEDAKLKEFIDKYGTGGNWIALPHKAGLKRCGKSCRLRWLNYLRPNIKHGEFSDEEDRIICTLFATIGSRWSIIAAQLPGRTDNDIKNYWNTKLKKKLLGISSSQRKQHNHHHHQQQQSQQQQQPLQPQLSSRTTGGHEVFPHSSSTDILINSVHQVHESPFGVPMMHHNNLLMFGGDQQSCSSSECNSNQISYGSKDVDLEGCYNLYSGIGENQRLLLYGGASEIERSNGFFGEAPLEFGFEDIKPMVFNNSNNNNNNGFFIEDQTTSMVRGDRNQGRFMYYC